MTRRLLKILPLALLITVITIVAGRLWFGSFSNLMAFANGQRLVVSNHDIYLGRVKPGQHEAKISVSNLSSQPITIIGQSGTCNCLHVRELPVMIPPWGTVPIEVLFSVGGESGKFRRSSELISSVDELVLTVSASGDLLPEEPQRLIPIPER
jgi:hypothetical protein